MQNAVGRLCRALINFFASPSTHDHGFTARGVVADSAGLAGAPARLWRCCRSFNEINSADAVCMVIVDGWQTAMWTGL